MTLELENKSKIWWIVEVLRSYYKKNHYIYDIFYYIEVPTCDTIDKFFKFLSLDDESIIFTKKEFIIYDEFVSTTNGTDVLKPLSKKINIISVNDMYHMMINILPTIHIESKLSKIQLHSSDFTADVVDHLENVL